MNFLLPAFAIIAALGFLLSALLHLAAVVGLQVPAGAWFMRVHMGALVVALPAVVSLELARRRVRPRPLWTALRDQHPGWLRRAPEVLFAYACVSFAFVLSRVPRTFTTDDGIPPIVLRGFSGHWLFFYGVALLILRACSKLGRPSEPRTGGDSGSGAGGA